MTRIRLGPHRPQSGNARPSQTPGPDDPIPSVEERDRCLTEEISSPAPSISIHAPRSISTFDFSVPNPCVPSSASSTPHDGRGDVGSVENGFGELRLGSSASPSPSVGFGLESLRDALPPAGTRTPSPRGESQRPLVVPRPVSRGLSPYRGHRRSSSANRTKYDVRQEAPPDDRFHAPEFQQALANARSLMDRLAGLLGSSDVHREPDSMMKTLRDRATELARFRCPPTRTVGLVGDSGVGKSSLINSLLDFPNLAPASNEGAACTCVVTEYRYHDRADFAIDVVLFTEAELREQLSKMVLAYRHFHSAEMEPDEKKHCENQSKLAEDTFEAMFADRSKRALELLHSDMTDEHIVETLLGWAMRLRSSHDICENAVRSSLKECSDLLMSLTTVTAAVQGSVVAWPYIKKISVSLDAYILSKGLVLVDLPGLRDSNATRQNITEGYLRSCDEIFAICPIGRATTDKGVKEVFELARHAMLSNISIICTKCDDIRAHEAERNWGIVQADEVRTSVDLLETAEQEYSSVREELEELRECGDELDEHEKVEKARLSEEKDRLDERIENHKFELQRYLITTRNAHVRPTLLNHYRDRTQGGSLHVFCASNSLYWDKRDSRPLDRAAAFLELSGIIAIRRHCMALVSESQLRIATQYLQDDIPSLLSNIELWVDSGAGTADAEKKQAVREALDALGDSLQKELLENPSLNDLAQGLTDAFHQRVYRPRQVHRWTEGATQAGDNWSTSWSPGSYAAFCRQYGTHSTATKGYHCWNEEAMEAMNKDLARPWSLLREEVNHQLQRPVTLISEAFNSAVDRHIDNARQEFPESTRRPLRTALRSSQRILAGQLEELGAKFKADLSNLRTDALSGGRKSYFGQSMESSYFRANCESGSGSWERKKNIINEALRDQQRFEDLMRKLKTKFRDLAVQVETEALALVEEHLGVVEDTLDLVRSENTALESERDPAFRVRVADELRDVMAAMERIRVTVGNA